jgi:hypothetical protein
VKRKLYGMQFTTVSEAFDSRNFAAIGFEREHCARLYRPTVDMHNTGTALTGVTPNVRPGEIKIFTQHLPQ